jgi:hypothetical protein
MANNNTYLPRKEADLLIWAANLNARLAADAARYRVTVDMQTAYETLFNTFSAKYTAANEDITRTPVAIQAKNTAKRELINGDNGIRQIVDFVQGNPATTDEMRQELQITVRDPGNTPVPVPKTAPIINIVDAAGTYVTIDLRDAKSPESRAKPFGVAAAAVLTAFGPVAPDLADKAAWTWQGNATRTNDLTLEFPGAASGTTVWITSLWQNTRGETGPPTQPISAQIPGQAGSAQSQTLTFTGDEDLQEAA